MATAVNKRLHYLDALRGIAALSVMVYHYVVAIDPSAVTGGEAAVRAVMGDVLDLGKFGVVLFFLISGYIIPNSLGPTGDRIGRFCISRFFRLYPLFWLVLLFSVLLPWPRGTVYGVPTILANATMLEGYLGRHDIVGAAWTLQIELTFYGCCVVLAFFHRMRSPVACALMSAGFLALALVVAIGRDVLVMRLPTALPLALSLMFFGTIWRQATLAGDPAAKRYAPWLLGAILLLLMPISMLSYNAKFDQEWHSYTVCYALAILTFVVCTTKVLIEWRPIVWLGEISYSLYLLPTLVAASAFYAGFFPETSPLDPFVYVALLSTIATVCAWCTYRFVEQPFVRLGHRLAAALAAWDGTTGGLLIRRR